MKVRKLSWAGAEFDTGSERLFIDPLVNVSRLEQVLGLPTWPMVPVLPSDTPTNVLLTHKHPDHFDPELLTRVLGTNGQVYCPAGMAEEVQAAGLSAISMEPWQTTMVGALKVTAVPAVDWQADDQVSWVVADSNRQVFHGGDTIWHGHWWNIQRRFGAFDLAMLAVNGVVVEFPGMKPTPIPATLTPEQAVAAACVLEARLLCPSHYKLFNHPPSYQEQEDIQGRLNRSAEAAGLPLKLVDDGNFLLN